MQHPFRARASRRELDDSVGDEDDAENCRRIEGQRVPMRGNPGLAVRQPRGPMIAEHDVEQDWQPDEHGTYQHIGRGECELFDLAHASSGDGRRHDQSDTESFRSADAERRSGPQSRQGAKRRETLSYRAGASVWLRRFEWSVPMTSEV